MKKTLSILLTLALLLGMGAVGASALKLPEPKIEFPSGASVLNLPKPKLEAPAFSPAFFAAARAATQALTEEELDDVLWQLEYLYDEAFMAFMIQMELLDYSSPALLLVAMFIYNPESILKDGVSLADLQQAITEAMEEIEKTVNIWMSPWILFDELFWGTFLDFFGLDDFPDEEDELLEALQAALEDGSLQAAIDGAMQACLAEWRAAYAYLNDALAACIKPDALAFAVEYSELARLYNEFYFNLMMLDPDDLTDEEIEALVAILYAIDDIIYDVLDETMEALLMADKWAEAAALLSQAVEDVTKILETVVYPPSPTYTLSYNLQGGAGGPSPLAVSGLEKNTLYTLSTAAPTRAGYTFGGWAAASSSTTAITKIRMTGNKTVYAIWAPVPVFYTLTYDANGGTGGPAAQADIPAGTQVDLATTNLPTRAGYNFKGWSESATGTAIVTKVTVNGDKKVYAVWEQKSAFELWKDKLADGKFGGIFKGLANWANWLLYIIFYGLFGWLMNLIIK